MGNCHTEDSHENRRFIGNPLIEAVSPKSFTENSQFQFLIRTWEKRSLPNLRNIEEITQKSHFFDESGKVTFSSKLKSTIFRPSQAENISILPSSHNFREHPASVIELEVKKNKSFFEVNFINEPGYELLTGKKQVSIGEKFFIGGLEYQMVGFFMDDKNSITRFGKAQKTRDSSDFSNSFGSSSISVVQGNKKNGFETKDKQCCRICLGNEKTKGNPFVCPCDCTGSVKYCHLNCWKKWMMSFQTSNSHYYRGSIRKEQCQLCKKNLTIDEYYKQNVTSLLMSISKMQYPFVLLEAVQPLTENCLYLKRGTQKLSYVFISFAQKSKLTLGNSSEADIPLISNPGKARQNASIELKDGKIILDDSRTKYGTFMKRENPIIIKDNVPRHFLFKNNLISLNAE